MKLKLKQSKFSISERSVYDVTVKLFDEVTITQTAETLAEAQTLASTEPQYLYDWYCDHDIDLECVVGDISAKERKRIIKALESNDLSIMNCEFSASIDGGKTWQHIDSCGGFLISSHKALIDAENEQFPMPKGLKVSRIVDGKPEN